MVSDAPVIESASAVRRRLANAATSEGSMSRLRATGASITVSSTSDSGMPCAFA